MAPTPQPHPQPTTAAGPEAGGPAELVRSHDAATDLLREVYDEMVRQDAKWPWPRPKALHERDEDVLFCLMDAEDVVEELVQVAAVALSWAQAIREQQP